LVVTLDVGETDQDDPFAPAALHLDPVRHHLGQQVAAFAAALLGWDDPVCVTDHAMTPAQKLEGDSRYCN